tara:strand:- start:635 stop:991 length:357 start_codon:yes stop_codon:yes gene_type:complete
MLKLTLWFDKFDSVEDQEKQLENFLSKDNKEINIEIASIVSIKYSKKIGELIRKYNINSFSFENLQPGDHILYENKKQKIKFMSSVNPTCVRIVNDLGNIEHINIGDFDLLDKGSKRE